MLWSLSSLAVAGPVRGSAYVELGGSGLIYSVNAGLELPFGTQLHVGAAAVPQPAIFGSDSDVVFTVPVGVSQLVGGDRHRLELGLTGVPHVGPAGTGFYATPVIGYNRRADSGFLFRATFTPVILRGLTEATRVDVIDVEVADAVPFPFFGISLGYTQ